MLKKTPADEVFKKWTQELRKESRLIDREIKTMDREAMKHKTALKKAAKEGNNQAVMTLGKALVQHNKTRDRYQENKARINSVMMTMKTNAATLKAAGVMKQSANIMGALRNLGSIKQFAGIAKNMSKEMMKAGIMNEMVDDVMSMADGDDVELAADDEVSKVVAEITSEKFDKVEKIQDKPLDKEEEEEEEDDDVSLEDMQAKLQKLSA